MRISLFKYLANISALNFMFYIAILKEIMANTESKPFSMGYVLRTTAKHMRKSIDISIRKTFERISEFDGDQDKSKEIFKTLSTLHDMRKQIDDFQLTNKEEFSGV